MNFDWLSMIMVVLLGMKIDANITYALWLLFFIQFIIIDSGIDLAKMLCEYLNICNYCTRARACYELAIFFYSLFNFF